MRRGTWILGLAVTTVVWGEPSLPVKIVKLQRTALGGRFVVDVSYPQIPGRPDLNRKLRALLPADAKTEEVEEGTILHVEEDFKVTYNAHGLLSVYGEGLSMSTRDGHPNEAHPTKLFGGVTLDSKTGQIYSLRDLFGTSAYAKLDPLVGMGAAAEMGQKEPVAVTQHTYHCYLGSRGVTFYQIFDNFVAGSVQVCLPYAQALPLANPSGPLTRLK